MTQNQLNREVARATGDTVEVIRKLGFNLNVVLPRWHNPRPCNSRRRQRSKGANLNIHQPKAA
jgi:hypothetical protein